MKTFSTDQMKVGFIGLGNMGSRIAQRLLDHGYRLEIHDRDSSKAAALAANGADVAKNVFELAGTEDVLLSCLTNDEAVRTVYLGPAGVLSPPRTVTSFLEMDTILPESLLELHIL